MLPPKLSRKKVTPPSVETGARRGRESVSVRAASPRSASFRRIRSAAFDLAFALVYPKNRPTQMNQQALRPKVIIISVLSALGIAYSTFLHFRPTLTGGYQLDGIIGVVLGLYISSLPAANLVDIWMR